MFAERELLDEVEDHRVMLSALVEEFVGVDPTKLARLQRLQEQIVERLNMVRLTATKLKAVRSFVG